MIKEIIEKYKTTDDYLRWQYLSESAFDDLEADLQKYMDEEMIKFAEWIINEDWIQTTTGKWEQVDPPFLTAENNAELLNLYKNR